MPCREDLKRALSCQEPQAEFRQAGADVELFHNRSSVILQLSATLWDLFTEPCGKGPAVPVICVQAMCSNNNRVLQSPSVVSQLYSAGTLGTDINSCCRYSQITFTAGNREPNKGKYSPSQLVSIFKQVCRDCNDYNEVLRLDEMLQNRPHFMTAQLGGEQY